MALVTGGELVVRTDDHGGAGMHHAAVGFGLGLAIGAQVADARQPVPSRSPSFDTMARQALPIVVVIMNNRSWGASQHFQELVSGR